MKKQITFLLLIFVFLLFACENQSKDVNTLLSKTDEGINAVIEIPAGTNHKIEYNPKSKNFEMNQENGQERMIDFLPYPANYGFVPSTKMDKKRGGDGKALDVLVIAESIKTGTILKVKPIATLLLEDDGLLDAKIVAVPIDSTLSIIKANDFQTFMIDYFAVKQIIQDWFLNYKGLGKMKMLGWRDENFALQQIEKWQIKMDE